MNNLVWRVTSCLLMMAATGAIAAQREPIPDKLVVLTFDDSKASHYTVVRPILKKYGFSATFFITEGFSFRTNKEDYLTWEQIGELHRDGFEIGNHTRDHKGVSKATLAGLREQVEAINAQCAIHGVPAPVSFAYPGNAIEPGSLQIIEALGFRFARRGGAPEYPYEEGNGVAYEPGRDHPLLLPSAGRCTSVLDAGQPETRYVTGEKREDRHPPVPRRARSRTSVGAHTARTIRGVHEIPSRRGVHGDRIERSRKVRGLATEARRSVGDHRSTAARVGKPAAALTSRSATLSSARPQMSV